MSNSIDIELANPKQEFTITVYTENQIGILNRIAIIFSRRKINIESLNVSPSEIEHIHRFNILITETEDVKYMRIPMKISFGRSSPYIRCQQILLQKKSL
jgi:glycine cleavage system regulatory protein